MAAHIHYSKSPASATATAMATEGRLPTRIFLHRNSTVHFSNDSSSCRQLRLRLSAVDRSSSNSGGDGGGNGSGNNSAAAGANNLKKKGGVGSASSSTAVPNSNYVVPLEKSSSITRPLGEILRDLNKKIPENIIQVRNHGYDSTYIPWYHANRMLSFYAPGWIGEIRDVIFSDNGSVTVVYRVTIMGCDGEAYRESTGTVSSTDGNTVDPVGAAEEIAFCRACARFGLGLYLYQDK